MTTYSLNGIINKVNEIQNLITLNKVHQASRSHATFTDLQQRVFLHITHLVEGIDQELSRANLTGADLAIRSRRGYQWLKFLSNPDCFTSHLDALQRINHYLVKDRENNRLDLTVTFYHQSSLYKVHYQESTKKITAQESFITAPDRILKALIEVALDPSSTEARIALRDHTFTKEYQRIRKGLEYLGVPPGSYSAGQAHHLEKSFHRVNQAYFEGRLEQPHLVWSCHLTRRKYGHYQWDTDTVMISKSLDQEWVPALVVDFVLYHELLHKKMGVKQANHNRIAHTREFREAEGKFKNVDKARQFLNLITKKRARSKK